MEHGKENFDEQYFGMFFKNYNQKELDFYYRWFKGWFKFINRYLPIKNGKGKKALEVGCAIGAFSKILSEHGFYVEGTDISSFILKRAKKNVPNIKFFVSDIEEDIPTKIQFDYIFSFEVLEHLKDPKKALSNIKKALKEEGVLVFSTPIPTKKTLADPMHLNVHKPIFWLSLGKKLGYRKMFYKSAIFIPFLYRLSSFFSLGLPIKLNLPFLNSTCFYFFSK